LANFADVYIKVFVVNDICQFYVCFFLYFSFGDAAQQHR